uniref:hypothetical protein n=1 Tax=Sulfurimonas sp. TaxID=2022749 RepID=UPI003D112526
MSKPITFNQTSNINQEIQGRLRLLGSQSNEHEAIKDGSFSVYNIEGFSAVNRAYEFHITFVSDKALSVEDMVDTNAQLLLTNIHNIIE